mmetsp:Transcript_15281/g.21082  ORF Transcript_15281/g.21082 Transcript_15281/m.21082 type:complete len:146 (-) Transcript_15281:34-471(-)
MITHACLLVKYIHNPGVSSTVQGGLQEGVLTVATDQVVEQESMQMLLAYTVLLTKFHDQGATLDELGKACEAELQKRWRVDVNFDVCYGVEMLTDYFMCSTQNERIFPVPLFTALENLDSELDKYFLYSKTTPIGSEASRKFSQK